MVALALALLPTCGRTRMMGCSNSAVCLLLLRYVKSSTRPSCVKSR